APGLDSIGRGLQGRAGQIGSLSGSTLPRVQGNLSYGAHTLLGLAQTNEQRDAILDQSQAAGAKFVRYSIAWEAVNTGPGVFQFTRADALVQATRQRGMEPVVDLAYTPQWASSAPGCPAACPSNAKMYPPADYSTWTKYVQAMAARYLAACA